MAKERGGQEQKREVRVALVLYGGVSLAIYENGVTGAFWDLVKASGDCRDGEERKSRGYFKLLLELLGARAVIDVVAGTSAGGINGLLLGAALESGSDFAGTSELWRHHGDFGKLLRPVPRRKDYDMESLLSDSYYLDHLHEAFTKLLSSSSGSAAYESEMDIYITGTDLEGHVNTCRDFLGNRIEDKEYRTLFQLKYRPDRRFLGLSNEVRQEKKEEDRSEQAWILASLARITSSFPAAFPPFHVNKVDENYQKQVRKALTCTARTEGNAGYEAGWRYYVDGGVLDNKPFGPALEAIFYRMPKGIVDRRLFYVEPDPRHFTETSGGAVKRHNPVGVAIDCLTTIPGHESIGGDLRELKKHNTRVRWLTGQRNYLLQLYEQDNLTEYSRAGLDQYRRIRIDSLARSLLMESDRMSSATTEIVESGKKELYREIRRQLEEMAAQPPPEFLRDADKSCTGCLFIDLYDVDLHLRLNFQRLNLVYEELTVRERQDGPLAAAVNAVGRAIKFIKVVRSALLNLRQQEVRRAVAKIGDGENEAEVAEDLVETFRAFLDCRGDLWESICTDLEKCGTLELFADRDNGPLDSQRLSSLLRRAGQSAASTGEAGGQAVEGESAGTVLGVLSTVLGRLLMESGIDGTLKSRLTFEALEELDIALFPLHFFSGIYELDEVECVRISPKDAKTGLSNIEAREKVTGDELAHFAGFFRRDWRSNDILWGRLDAVCQISESLLDPEAMQRIAARKAEFDEVFSPENLRREYFPDCPEKSLIALAGAWEDLNRDNCGKAPGRRFRECFIEASQHQAVARDFEEVVADRNYQEIAFGRLQGPCGETSASDPANIASAAGEMAAKELAGLAKKKESKGQTFKSSGIGLQTVFGVNSKVPLHILGEYCSQAFLILWGMLRFAVRGKGDGGGVFDSKILRFALWHPVNFTYRIIHLMRTQPNSTPLVLTAVASALATATVISLFAGIGWSLVALAAVALFWIIMDRFCPEIYRLKWRRLRRVLKTVLLAAVIVGALGLLVSLWD